jgi:excinuclease ABC subunit C
METVARNATQSLARHKVARAGDLTARSQALQQTPGALGLDDAPLRIECFDISHVQGTQVVGSMVVFEDGLPRKSEYRRFIVRGDETGATDDTAAMHEVLTRRLRRGRRGTTRPPRLTAARTTRRGSARASFAYRPNLVVVDGGLPQVNAAARALADAGAQDVAVVGLAKRLEEVWIPGEDHPLVLARSSEGLYLLQRLRDEAHRFAVTFHRQRRSKAMTASRLDGIPGLGEAAQGPAQGVRLGQADLRGLGRRARRGSRNRACAGSRDCGTVGLRGHHARSELATGEVVDEGNEP